MVGMLNTKPFLIHDLGIRDLYITSQSNRHTAPYRCHGPHCYDPSLWYIMAPAVSGIVNVIHGAK